MLVFLIKLLVISQVLACVCWSSDYHYACKCIKQPTPMPF